MTVTSAMGEIEAGVARLESELRREIATGEGEVIAQARAFARFQILAFQHCSDAAAVLGRARDGVAAEDVADLERLAELGQGLETACRRGLTLLRDRLAQTATASIEWSTGRLREALVSLGEGGDAVAGDPVGSGKTRPMAVAPPRLDRGTLPESES